MDTIVKVGQVWRDKDKRRNTVIEIIEGPWLEVKDDAETPSVRGLVVGTEEERVYSTERLVKRWELRAEKEEIIEMMAPEVEKKLKTAKKAMAAAAATLTESGRLTREQWLERAVQVLTDEVFTPQGIEVPKVRVSVGWPGGRGPKKNIIGQCFADTTTGDKVAQIFISPVLEDAYGVVETMAHELIHAIAVDEDGVSAGHKGEFIRIAKLIGFTKPWRSTPATDEFRVQLQAIANMLVEYPHSAIRQTERPKVQKTYYLRVKPVECGECDPDYVIRITSKWLEEGAPLCPHGVKMEEA